MCAYDFFPPISEHFFSAGTCGGGGGGLSSIRGCDPDTRRRSASGISNVPQ